MNNQLFSLKNISKEDKITIIKRAIRWIAFESGIEWQMENQKIMDWYIENVSNGRINEFFKTGMWRKLP